MDRFQKLDFLRFDDPATDPQDFLDKCHEILCNLGHVVSNRVNFS